MNLPMILVLVFGGLALAVSAFSRNRGVFIAGMFAAWLCICYMLLIPFTGAARMVIMSVDASSHAYVITGNALNRLLNEVVPARLAVAAFSLVMVLLISFRIFRKSTNQGSG